MKKIVGTVIFFILLFGAFPAQAIDTGSSPTYAFSDQELDNLLAPIALYPDPLLAVMLPASTYPEEIADADAWMKRGGTASGIDAQRWDESVKAIAYYPDILEMMAGDLDWIANLGDAFLDQPENVTRAIQRLRWQAKNDGNLESNDKQQVFIDGDDIEIIPAQPEYMYVPQYDPSVVYEEGWAPGSPPFITYGFGLAVGGWLSMDFDWRHRHVIYHGWNRPGWVNHARPYVHVSNVYINKSRPFINQTWRHDMSHGDPEKFRTSHPGRVSTGGNAQTPVVRGRETTPTKPSGVVFGPRGDTNSFSSRGRQSLGTITQRQAPPAAVSRQPSVSPPTTSRQPSVSAPAISRQPAMPPPAISRQPSVSPPAVSRQPSMQPPPISRQPSIPPPATSRQPSLQAPAISRGSSQPRPATERMQPPATPSVTFGGYRGGSEARSQSLRGETSRQSSTVTRPSAAPPSRVSPPAGKSPSGGRPGR